MTDNNLTCEDWQFIYLATSNRLKALRPTPSEPEATAEFKGMEERITTFLDHKAYGK